MSFVTPALLIGLSTAISVVGTVISTSAAIQQSNYQAQIAQRQAQVDKENAARATFQSQVEQQEQDRDTAAAIGSMVAQQGASGLSVNSGSSILTRKSAAMLGRKDALNIRQAGDLTAQNFLQHSQDSLDAASQAQSQANNSLLQGFLGVGNSIIGGAKSYVGLQGNAAQKYSTAAVPGTILF